MKVVWGTLVTDIKRKKKSCSLQSAFISWILPSPIFASQSKGPIIQESICPSVTPSLTSTAEPLPPHFKRLCSPLNKWKITCHKLRMLYQRVANVQLFYSLKEQGSYTKIIQITSLCSMVLFSKMPSKKVDWRIRRILWCTLGKYKTHLQKAPLHLYLFYQRSNACLRLHLWLLTLHL